MKTYRNRYALIQTTGLPTGEDGKSSLVDAILGKIRERSRPEEPIGFRFRVIDYDGKTSRGIVKVTPHTAVEKIRKLVSSENRFHGQPVKMSILGTSGTIKALRRKYCRKR